MTDSDILMACYHALIPYEGGKEAYEKIKLSLEQEPILDKIRAEIKQYQSDYDIHGTEYDRTAWKAFNRCLQIIDKYKAESEPQESEDKEQNNGE